MPATPWRGLLAAENAEVIETIDINPFLVLSDEAAAVDALIVPKTSMWIHMAAFAIPASV